MVQEGELGVKEFQMAVLSALLNLMKEQESLNQTLKALTDKEKVKLEEIDNLFSEDSSDEEDERRGIFLLTIVLLSFVSCSVNLSLGCTYNCDVMVKSRIYLFKIHTFRTIYLAVLTFLLFLENKYNQFLCFRFCHGQAKTLQIRAYSNWPKYHNSVLPREQESCLGRNTATS